MWITSRPGRFIARRQSRCLLNRRLGGPQSWSVWFWKTENLLPHPRFDHRTLQSVASRCSDYSVRPSKFGKKKIKSVRSDRPARDLKKYVDLWRYLAVYETRTGKMTDCIYDMAPYGYDLHAVWLWQNTNTVIVFNI